MKENTCGHFRSDVLQSQAYELRKGKRKFRSKIDKPTVTAVHIFPFQL